MRSTGIVRRMDELGRVVIPKELRRTMRIKEGEEIEVIQKDDTLILKKYSAVSEMLDFQAEYASSIYRTTGYTAIITDTDKIVAISGDLLKRAIGSPIDERLQEIIELRRTEILKDREIKPFFEVGCEGVKGQVIVPIMVRGDIMGAVILYSKKEPNDTLVKTAETGAHFLGLRL